MDLGSVIKTQREFYYTGVTKDLQFRKNSLEKLLESVMENEPVIYNALYQDMGRAKQEAYMTEIGPVIMAIKYALKNIDSWVRNEKIKTPRFLMLAKSMTVREPYGTVLIMSHWNYPFYLTMAPLIGAIAAGNCAIIKTPKTSPYTSGAVVDIINFTFDRNYVYAIDEVIPYDDILRQKYDYIFFTGSERVGKTVMRAAADNLTPVTLELGGKNPCIIDETADIELAAKKIMWSKILNAGQSATAPDYVLVPVSVKQQLIDALTASVKELVGDPFANGDYPRIINLHHYMRLKNLIDKGRVSGVIGGRCDDSQMRIEPAVFPDVTFDDDIMRNEIFGPILPVISYDDREEMLALLKRRPKSLALYIFTEDKESADEIISDISFGSCCVNDCMVQMTNEALPFGGIGTSGMGTYHGKSGFDTFSHVKSVLRVSGNTDMGVKYPPYTEHKMSVIRRMMK